MGNSIDAIKSKSILEELSKKIFDIYDMKNLKELLLNLITLFGIDFSFNNQISEKISEILENFPNEKKIILLNNLIEYIDLIKDEIPKINFCLDLIYLIFSAFNKRNKNYRDIISLNLNKISENNINKIFPIKIINFCLDLITNKDTEKSK
jgi:hypothetical protein